MEPLNTKQIQAILATDIRAQLRFLQVFTQIDSTNDYALSLAPEQAPLACLAEFQTAGRGQHGRTWLSPYGSGLCLSCQYVYPLSPKLELAGLNLALAIAAAEVLQQIGVPKVGIKWPNDIVWQGQKLAGLLLETRLSTDYQAVVIGIGLNVQTPAIHMNAVQQPWVDLATCLSATSVAVPDRNQLAAYLIEHFLKVLMHYPQQGFAVYQAEWARFDVLMGKRVNLSQPSRLSQQAAHWVQGIAQGIDASGALLVEVAGQQQRYLSGEVSVRDATAN